MPYAPRTRTAYRRCFYYIYFILFLFISLIHQQSYQTVAAKGIRHADGKAIGQPALTAYT